MLRRLTLFWILKISLAVVIFTAQTQPSHAQSANPFQRDQSKLIQQLADQKKAETQPVAPVDPAQAQTKSPLPFDISPELLRQLQTVEEPDYTSHFTNMNVVAVNGVRALIRSNDYFYYVKDGGSFTHDGLRFFVEIRDLIVHVLSPMGTELYVGSVGSGPKPAEIDTAEESTSK